MPSAAHPSINVTPLINILLVLLIIFMVAVPLKPARFAARLPAEPQDLPKLNRAYRFDMLLREDLPPESRIERTVFIKAPVSLRYGDVAKVIDGIKGAGADPIGLQLDRLD